MYTTGTLPTNTTTMAGLHAVLDGVLGGLGWDNLGIFPDPDYATSYPNDIAYTKKYHVWRASMAVTGEDQNLYLVMFSDSPSDYTTNGDITAKFTVHEDFDTATSKTRTGISNTSSFKTDANGLAVPSGPYAPRDYPAQVLRIPSGGQYWISATNKRLLITARASGGGFTNVYGGFVTNIMSTSIPNVNVPIWMGTLLADSGSNNGGWIREPGAQITVSTYAFGSSITYPTVTYYDNVYYGGYVGVAPYVCHNRGNMVIPRATIDGLMVFSDPVGTGPGAFVAGDTITTNNTTYVCFGPSTSRQYPQYFMDTAA